MPDKRGRGGSVVDLRLDRGADRRGHRGRRRCGPPAPPPQTRVGGVDVAKRASASATRSERAPWARRGRPVAVARSQRESSSSFAAFGSASSRRTSGLARPHALSANVSARALEQFHGTIKRAACPPLSSRAAHHPVEASRSSSSADEPRDLRVAHLPPAPRTPRRRQPSTSRRDARRRDRQRAHRRPRARGRGARSEHARRQPKSTEPKPRRVVRVRASATRSSIILLRVSPSGPRAGGPRRRARRRATGRRGSSAEEEARRRFLVAWRFGSRGRAAGANEPGEASLDAETSRGTQAASPGAVGGVGAASVSGGAAASVERCRVHFCRRPPDGGREFSGKGERIVTSTRTTGNAREMVSSEPRPAREVQRDRLALGVERVAGEAAARAAARAGRRPTRTRRRPRRKRQGPR